MIAYFAYYSTKLSMRVSLFFLLLLVILTHGCTQSTNDNQEKISSLNGDISLPAQIKKLNGTDILYIIDKESTLKDTLIDNVQCWRANGDMFFKIDREKYPVYIYTSLMKLEVMAPSTFRIAAYDHDQGQSVESLTGKIKISKNYSSPFPEPDTLQENNLYMVNKSIDLSEKEDLEDKRLQHWWKKVNENQ